MDAHPQQVWLCFPADCLNSLDGPEVALSFTFRKLRARHGLVHRHDGAKWGSGSAAGPGAAGTTSAGSGLKERTTVYLQDRPGDKGRFIAGEVEDAGGNIARVAQPPDESTRRRHRSLGIGDRF